MKFKVIGLAKERVSPENPGAFEKRVALIPKDLKRINDFGTEVFVESGAGEGVGFSDQEYRDAGATIQNSNEIYKNKDLLIKFKGPSIEDVDLMKSGSSLFCMAHFNSFPERAKLLMKNKINVLAMEEVRESPKYIKDEIIISKMAMQRTLESLPVSSEDLNIYYIGYSGLLIGGIRRAGNRSPNKHSLFQGNIDTSKVLELPGPKLIVLDSSTFNREDLKATLKEEEGTFVLDIADFKEMRGLRAIDVYRGSHPPFDLGLRKIQCLHETGIAGARYGFKLLEEESSKKLKGSEAKVCILGYGNVGMGAIHECFRQGVKEIRILGKRHTEKGTINNYIKDADLIINGAEQPVELRGKNFLIRKEHVKDLLGKGTVVIDLVGGSEANRSPVENIISCTFLNDPFFIEDEIYFSALWGWPMMGMMKETAVKYSGQITEILLGKEKLINGIRSLSPGLKESLVCGPF